MRTKNRTNFFSGIYTHWASRASWKSKTPSSRLNVSGSQWPEYVLWYDSSNRVCVRFFILWTIEVKLTIECPKIKMCIQERSSLALPLKSFVVALVLLSLFTYRRYAFHLLPSFAEIHVHLAYITNVLCFHSVLFPSFFLFICCFFSVLLFLLRLLICLYFCLSSSLHSHCVTSNWMPRRRFRYTSNKLLQ